MRIFGYALYLIDKYAEENIDDAPSAELKPDNSLGIELSPEQARARKDNIIKIFTDVKNIIPNTQLPWFKVLSESLSDNPVWLEFERILTNLVNYVEYADLLQSFIYVTRKIQEINKLVEMANKEDLIPKVLKNQFIKNVSNTQDKLWTQIKKIVNLHDFEYELRGREIDVPSDIKRLIKELKPTWHYGPVKNPTQKIVKKRPLSFEEKMVMQDLIDKYRKDFGPSALQSEVEEAASKEYFANKEKEKKESREESVAKYNKSLKNKEKF